MGYFFGPPCISDEGQRGVYIYAIAVKFAADRYSLLRPLRPDIKLNSALTVHFVDTVRGFLHLILRCVNGRNEKGRKDIICDQTQPTDGPDSCPTLMKTFLRELHPLCLILVVDDWERGILQTGHRHGGSCPATSLASSITVATLPEHGSDCS